jgi:hypothetical protein
VMQPTRSQGVGKGVGWGGRLGWREPIWMNHAGRVRLSLRVHVQGAVVRRHRASLPRPGRARALQARADALAAVSQPAAPPN